MNRRKNGTYRADLENLYARIAVDDCHVCGEPLGEDRTQEHVPSLALVRDRGPFGPMVVTQSHAACNRGLIEE